MKKLLIPLLAIEGLLWIAASAPAWIIYYPRWIKYCHKEAKRCLNIIDEILKH